MKPSRSLFLTLSISAAIASTAHAAAPTKDELAKENAKQIQQLREQLEVLQRKMDAQTASEEQAKADAAAAKAQAAAATAAAKSAADAVPVQVKKEVDAAKPKTDKVYIKGVSLTFGGFSALETIYRSRNETADISSSFTAIPFANGAVGHTNELRFTARQSRVSALAQGDVSPDTHLGFYGEFDFQAAAQTANSNQSNSYNPRIRHIYGQIDWDTWGLHFLAGQNWSLATLNNKGITPRAEVAPLTIDAQYVPGFTWTRQPQIRITKDFDKTFWLALSVENPQTTFYTGANAFPASVHLTYNSAAGSGFNSANTLSVNHVPDVIAKAAYEPKIGERTMHFEVFGLYRSFYERLNFANENASGGGAGFGLIIPVVPKILDFQLSGLAGKGIGRYGTAGLPDVTFDAAGNIRPIKEFHALAGLTVHATPKVDVYVYGGEEKESGQSYNLVDPVTGAITPYGYGNPRYDNSACAYEGAAGACVGNTGQVVQGTVGFWHRPYSGAFGRFQWGVQYSYTERHAFNGNGGAPLGVDSMLFTSFRYYPFN